MAKDLIIQPEEQLDLFVADILDVAPKGDMMSMEFPLFSLSKKPDREPFRYVHPKLDAWIEIKPSTDGRATIFDKDVLLYCVGQVVEALNRGKETSRRINITPYDFFVTTGRGRSGDEYRRLQEAVARLRGTTIHTNITQKGSDKLTRKQADVFGLIDSAKVIQINGKTTGMEIVLSERLYESIKSHQVLTYSREYFKLTSPNERRLYELCRKHCGNQYMWEIKLENLYQKFGSRGPLSEFKRMLKKMVATQPIPQYHISLDKDRAGEKVTVLLDKTSEIKAITRKEIDGTLYDS